MRITHEDFINRFKECHGNSDPSPSQSSDPFVSLKLKLSSKHLLRFLCFYFTLRYSRNSTQYATPRRITMSTDLAFVVTIPCLAPCLENKVPFFRSLLGSVEIHFDLCKIIVKQKLFTSLMLRVIVILWLAAGS